MSKAKRTLASSLANFQFDCLGTSLTDDEIIIANSLKEFARFLNMVEDEMDRFLDHAHEKFIQPLMDFRKKQIGSVKMIKKDFDKVTSRFCTAQDNYIRLKKEESLAEAAENLRHEQKQLRSASLEYVYLMHVVQERKKFEFVEALLSFMHSWSNYYRFGHKETEASSGYMTDLQTRVQKCRENFNTTCDKYENLKLKVILIPNIINKTETLMKMSLPIGKRGFLFWKKLKYSRMIYFMPSLAKLAGVKKLS